MTLFVNQLWKCNTSKTNHHNSLNLNHWGLSGVYQNALHTICIRACCQSFKHCPYRMMMVFSEFGVIIFIEDFDCIILQSTRQVQYTFLWESFIKGFIKVLYRILLKLKEKYFLNYQYTCIVWWALEPWYDCWWWRFQCTCYEHLGLITNVIQWF